MNRYILCIVVVLIKCAYVVSYRHYQQNIPNGEHVPHPCKPNYIWHGVGHEKAGGSGTRNPFGKDFANANHVWKDVCQMDSDGDGMTNGQELGDPSCIWMKEQIPERVSNITHPGVCDPVNSPSCMAKNDFVDCNPAGDFQCDALNETETMNITVKFPETAVPAKETNYYCMVFELPQDGDYHLVASTPVIANEYVMHHILMFGCDESDGPVTEPLNAPQKCQMGNSKCQSIISLWAVGSHGECQHREVGIRFGNVTGYKKAMFQFHWNNPELKSDYVDSSGMTLYYTPVLRTYDAGTWTVGQIYLKIPPKQERVVQTGACAPECSQRNINDKIYITRAFNHMHYLGREMTIELIRNGSKVLDITNEPVYSYDSPVAFSFEDPIEVLPGDEVKVTCVFTSKYKTETTYFGEGTQEEMCFGFLTFHPVQNMQQHTCVTWKSLSSCMIWHEPESFPVIQNCRWREFMDFSNPATSALVDDIKAKCRPYQGCAPECLEKMRTEKEHPCLNNDIGDYIRNVAVGWKWAEMLTFIAATETCKLELAQATQNNSQCPVIENGSPNNPSSESEPNSSDILRWPMILFTMPILVFPWYYICN